MEASSTLKNTVDTNPTSTLSFVITDIWNLGSCLSKISTLWATLSTNGTIIERPDSRVLVYLPNLKTIRNELEKLLNVYTKNLQDNVHIYYFQTEKDLLKNVVRYIYNSTAIYITGWNIMKFDYPFLMNRLLHHQIIPPYIPESQLVQMYSCREVFDLAPPWLLSIDTMECRKRYFPRDLPVNPPSNSIDETARTCLDGISKDKIDIMKIHDAYRYMETTNNENILFDSDLLDYLKDLIMIYFTH